MVLFVSSLHGAAFLPRLLTTCGARAEIELTCGAKATSHRRARRTAVDLSVVSASSSSGTAALRSSSPCSL
ncbi:hypothetical protein B296_00027171 [Ensete ventricosum]|uniref:Secreted protein n=1 Tax=Ensete ventricosum TaxID=4639 RepID=A0A426XI62_ENSVE|nr:hypothetical protein B296_00027171 [Ensete ventricosum]